jgi:hypothetical protein
MNKNNISAESLADQIFALIPKYQQIMYFQSGWDLLSLPEFKDAYMTSTLDQADWALAKAKGDWAVAHSDEEKERDE